MSTPSLFTLHTPLGNDVLLGCWTRVANLACCLFLTCRHLAVSVTATHDDALPHELGLYARSHYAVPSLPVRGLSCERVRSDDTPPQGRYLAPHILLQHQFAFDL
ncbi:hypothetical protein BV22DRAFT_1135665 [Leucogyrophana mollusca]|uniref:Uncharacterized protein n=1 Tax=Leucogyrophana mollusca TaxID=85980 RepID=A0ACB8AXI2_9AGAM|nr:hypothetical protein BV22DRAFT_1135665 [Leucogyrophana mollusca]